RQRAEVRVVGVVLLHVDDDVLDLRQEVDAFRLARIGSRAGTEHGMVAGEVRQAGEAAAAGGEQTEAGGGESGEERTTGEFCSHERARYANGSSLQCAFGATSAASALCARDLNVSRLHVVHMMNRIVNEVARECLDGESRAVAARPLTLPLVVSDRV